MIFDSIIAGLNQLALDLAEIESILNTVPPVQLDAELTEATAELPSSTELNLALTSNVVSMLPARVFLDDLMIRPSNLSFCIKDGVLRTTVETNPA
jgi:hypothetical protein